MKFEPIPSPHIADYIVFGTFLCICTGIGIYYGYRTDKKKTLENYLFGNRKMQLVPVGLSLFVTFSSAISLMGSPAEMYVYGTMGVYLVVGYVISIYIAGVTLVPLLYPLKLTSTYEYLQLRFNSKCVRVIGTFLGMLQTIGYMGVTLYSPALALESVAGIPLWISIAIVGGIGTFYTSIGGIKSVIWTDVFQFIMVAAGLVTSLVKGVSLIEGSGSLQERLEAGHRLHFDNFSPDPRIRHTLWGCIIGVIFSWMPNWCNQSSVQRISSLRTLRAAKSAFFMMIPIILMYNIILAFMGLLMYAYYNILQCDPSEAGFVTSINQLMPYFVFDVLRTLPGFPGVYITCLFSGTLSTLSSGINALAANTIEDILPNAVKRSVSVSVTVIAKLAVIIYGGLAVGIAYSLKNVSGPVTQIAMSVFGAFGGPLAGLFFLGGLFPNSNWIGAVTGCLTALAVNMWVTVGGQLYGMSSPRLEPNPIHGCFPNNTTQLIWNVTDSITTTNFSYLTTEPFLISKTSYVSVFPLYNLSYTWYGMIGFSLTIVIGMLVSCATGLDRGKVVDSSLVFPCCRKFWGLEVDRQYMIETYKVAMIPEQVSQKQHRPKQSTVSQPYYDL